MRYKNVASAGTLAVTMAFIGSAVTVSGQGPAPAIPAPPIKVIEKKATPLPRTLDGKPDFSGIWGAFMLTPQQRPAGAPEFYAPGELEELQKNDPKERADLRIYGTVTPPGGKTVDAYNTLWRDGYWIQLNVPMKRTSQVIDPPDGRLPPSANNPEVTKIADERRMRQNRPPQGPEDRPIWTRCVRGQVSGPPLVGTSGSYNNNIQIVQGPDAFAVIQEMNHESQLVALDARPRPAEPVKLLKGSSRGHWEGDTLVIESTNFKASTLFEGAVMSVGGGNNSDKFHVTERYTPMDVNNIVYRATVEDPRLWTKPWTAEFVLWRVPDQKQLVEYACHEGNRSLEFALTGARALEAAGIVDPVFDGGDEEEAVR